jgi:membrane associated rhomboid family serine protease
MEIDGVCIGSLNFSFRYCHPDTVNLAVPKWFVPIYGTIELWAGVTGTQTGVAHFSHLGGMLFGYLLLLYWQRHPPGYR